MSDKYKVRRTSGRGKRLRRKRRKLQKGNQGVSRHLKIDRDKLNLASKTRVGSQTVRLFETLQKQPREVQLLALASAFTIMSETLRFPVGDTMAAIENLMKDPTTSSGRGLQFDAMKWHLATELEGQPE